MSDLVSIIIVNFNGLQWLDKCLGSLSKQTFKAFEIIFVDNNSSDGSAKFVENMYPNVVIIRSDKNLGFAGGNNLGIAKARGEYVLLINNDTWVEPDFLGKLSRAFKESGSEFIGPIESDYSSRDLRDYSIHLDPFGHHVYLHSKRKRIDDFYLSGVCLLFRKDSYVESRGLDNDFFMYGEDWDFFWRLQLLKKTFTKIDNVVVYHKGAGSSGGGVKYNSFLWRNQNSLQMLIKNYAWYNLVWTLPIYLTQNIFEMIFFLIILKPRIAFSYPEGWWFNLVNLRRTLKKRKWVQANRLIGDSQIFKRMYLGFGKIEHLLSLYGRTE